MGFNSIFIVLNDAVHQIGQDPDFGKKVYEKVLSWYIDRNDRDISSGNHCNAASIVSQDHADTYRCLIVGGNTAQDLGVVGHWSPYYRDEMNEQERKEYFLKNLADSLGFRIVRKKK